MAEEFLISTEHEDNVRNNTPAVVHPSHGQTFHSQSYYRSHFFSVNTASCPLIQAAMPLLIILARLAEEAQDLEPATLPEKLIHEINAFSSQVQTYAYPFETLVLSRYILAVSFDHFITSLDSNHAAIWQKFLLVDSLQAYHFNAMSDDTHFSHTENMIKITEMVLSHPKEQEDVLELIFLCLVFGFDRNFVLGTLKHATETVTYTTHMLLEKIYPLLQKKRAHIPALLNQPSNSVPLLFSHQRKSIVSRAFVITFFATTGILISCYMLFNHVFHLVLQPLFQQLNNLS